MFGLEDLRKDMEILKNHVNDPGHFGEKPLNNVRSKLRFSTMTIRDWLNWRITEKSMKGLSILPFIYKLQRQTRNLGI